MSSQVVTMLTRQLADTPIRGQSSCGLDNSRTCQLADNEFLKNMELLYFICTLNPTLTLTLANIGSVSVQNNTQSYYILQIVNQTFWRGIVTQ